jgi:hypothetical protein
MFDQDFQQLFQIFCFFIHRSVLLSGELSAPPDTYIIQDFLYNVKAFLKEKPIFLKIFLDKIQEIIYTCGEVMSMDFPTKIKMAEAVAKVKEAELARRMDTTPQAFNQRMKTGKFKYEELEQMAQAMGAELVVNFRFPDGTEV